MAFPIDALSTPIVDHTDYLILGALMMVAFGTFPLAFRYYLSKSRRSLASSSLERIIPHVSMRQSDDDVGHIDPPDRQVKRLGVGSIFLVLENLSTEILGAAFWLILARMVLPDVLGQALVVYSVTATVFGFTAFGVRTSLAKYISEYNAKKMYKTSKRILNLGLKMGLIIGIVAGVVVSLTSGYLSTVYQEPAILPLLVIALLTFVPSQTIVATLMGAYQGCQKSKFCWLSDVLYQASKLVLTIPLILLGIGSLGIILGISLGGVAVAMIGYLLLIPRSLHQDVFHDEHKVRMRDVLHFSGFNYLGQGMRTLSKQAGVLILGTQGFEWAAFFGMSVMVSSVVGGILIGISRALLPAVSEQLVTEGKQHVAKLLNTSVRIALLVSGPVYVVLLISPQSILTLLSKDYVVASSALQLLIVSSIIGAISMLIISALNGAGRAREVALLSVISSAITIVVTVLLIPSMGMVGAALGQLAGSIYLLSGSLITLARKEQIVPSAASMMKPTAALVASLGTGFLILTFIHQENLSIIVSLLTYIIVAKIYRAMTPRELKIIYFLALNALKFKG